MPEQRDISDALNFLATNSEAVILQVVDRQCAEWPQQAGSAQRDVRSRCVEDNRFHMHYLSAAVSAEDPTIFSEYCGWAKVVLQKRGIAVSHLEQNLRYLEDMVLKTAPERVADVIVGYLDIALRHLPEYPDEPAPIVVSESRGPLVKQYVEKIIALDAAGAARLIESRVTDAHSVLDLYVNVLQPAQREIGRLWQVNAISVAAEHYASATTQKILNRLSSVIPPRAKRNARFAGLCPEGEHHCLGLQMVCDLSQLDGWETYFIGANTPTNSGVQLLKQLQPAVVGVSMATLMALHNTRALITKVKEALPDTVVLAGGYAASLGKDIWKTFGADAYAADGESALATLNQILAGRKAAAGSRGNPRAG